MYNEKIIKISRLKDILQILNTFKKEFNLKLFENPVYLNEYAKKIFKNAEIYAIQDNEIVAFIMFYANDHINKRTFITLLGVKKEHRRKGLGKKLIDKCVEISRKEGMEKIELECYFNNENAKKFYEKEGFSVKKKLFNSFYMLKTIE